LDLKVGTYNVNNLFDRFDDPYSWSDDRWNRRATKPKSLDEIYQLGQRLRDDRPDILALQEVEGKGTLYEFNVSQLGRFFRDLALVPGNDPRRIDVAVGSRLPLGQVVSYQFIRDQETGRKLFSRDLIEVEVLNPDSPGQRMFTIFVTHLKSKWVDTSQSVAEQEKDRHNADILRWKQASTVANIVRSRFPNPQSRYIVAGDLNDTPDSRLLAPLLQNQHLPLFDVLTLLPQAERWTYHWKKEDQYSQIDYLLVSQGMRQLLQTDSVYVAQGHFTSGSDHHPVYATFTF
jgi:endonuclease/exonuclease/phosphatase family metal-dependent hydrolase